jgi:hypothetical protein
MSAPSIQTLLYFGGTATQIGVVVMMIRRDLRSTFPFFFSYNIFQVIATGLLFFILRTAPTQYFYAYWTYVSICTFIGLAVIHEVFHFAIRPYPGLRELGSVIFRWAALLLILLCTISAAGSNGDHAVRLTHGMVSLERSARLLQCGLLLFLGLCSTQLGLTWRSFACGVAVGFGTFAATDLAITSIAPSARYSALVNLITTGAYFIAEATWFGYAMFAKLERVHSNEFQPAFDRWNQAAMLVLGPKQPVNADHTYLSDIEKTVEAVMAGQPS